MRKMYQKKKKSCPLCKPHRTGGAIRWKQKDLEFIKRSEKEIKESIW